MWHGREVCVVPPVKTTERAPSDARLDASNSCIARMNEIAFKIEPSQVNQTGRIGEERASQAAIVYVSLYFNFFFSFIELKNPFLLPPPLQRINVNSLRKIFEEIKINDDECLKSNCSRFFPAPLSDGAEKISE
jgi:hypothetical protein